MILTMLRPIPQSSSSLPANSHNRPKKKRLLQKEKGFTLIEMIVVIVIIGILTSIAMGIFIHVNKTDELRTLTSAVNDPIKSHKNQKAPQA